MKSYENYPPSFVLGSNVLQLAIYAIGAYILYLTGFVWLILYLLYIAILEIRLLKSGCVHCYYYGKRCAFGKGSLCSIFFKKGHPEKFIDKQIRFIDIIPDFLVSIVPFIIAIYMLIVNFNWILLLLVVSLVILAFPINGFLRGS
jgi:hypothetical protein